MRSLIFNKEAVFGISLALMLQTKHRFIGPLGWGELLMLVYFLLAFVGFCVSGRNKIKNDFLPFSLFFSGVVLFLILPITVLTVIKGDSGASFRDLFAYLLVCATLLVAPKRENDIRVMVCFFLLVLFSIVALQYFFGGSSAYYYSRFSGGAKNPNQLALYLACAVVLSSFLESYILRIMVFMLSTFFGFVSYSDAFQVFLFASVFVFFAIFSVPSRLRVYAVPYFLVVVFFALLGFSWWDILYDKWVAADEGGARTVLAISALSAWLDTPFSMVFGHGAGSYSGFSGPFDGAEAHNTVLDIATIAGFFGLILFPVLPFLFVYKAIAHNYIFVPAVMVGVIAFSFFHFVGRQPVFWISLFLIFSFINKKTTAAD